MTSRVNPEADLPTVEGEATGNFPVKNGLGKVLLLEVLSVGAVVPPGEVAAPQAVPDPRLDRMQAAAAAADLDVTAEPLKGVEEVLG